MNEYWREDILKVLKIIKEDCERLENKLGEVITQLDGMKCDIEYTEGVVKNEVQ